VHRPAQAEVQRILEEGRRASENSPSLRKGTGLDDRINAIEEALLSLARLFDQAYVEKSTNQE
jgi:hypothetical protein